MTQMQTEEVAVWERAPEHSPEVLPKCGKCGKTDSTLRVSAFMYALSAFVITLRRRGSSGIFCQSCRRKEAIKWSLLTGVLGWWGIPWGPIFSVQSIVRNLRGGAQDAELNAELLKAIGKTLAERGETVEATRALEESVKLRDDPEVAQLLGQVHGYLSP
jgi:hypothetical protein